MDFPLGITTFNCSFVWFLKCGLWKILYALGDVIEVESNGTPPAPTDLAWLAQIQKDFAQILREVIPILQNDIATRGDPVFELLGFFANSALQEQPNELKNLSRGDLPIALPTVPKFFDSVNRVTVGGPTKA